MPIIYLLLEYKQYSKDSVMNYISIFSDYIIKVLIYVNKKPIQMGFLLT